MYLVTKASDPLYYSFTNEVNVESLYNKYNSFVFMENDLYQKDCNEIFLEYFGDKLTIDDAEKISQCKYEIKIYDYYLD